MKEAINLFEEEKRHDIQMNQLNTIQQMQFENNRLANQANTIGWMNFFSK